MLSQLSNDPASLLKLVADTGPGSCPALPIPLSLDGETAMSLVANGGDGTARAYACGLRYVNYKNRTTR